VVVVPDVLAITGGFGGSRGWLGLFDLTGFFPFSMVVNEVGWWAVVLPRDEGVGRFVVLWV
jgi:hypothetical protein